MSAPVCTCDSKHDWERDDCPVHVHCDERCRALVDPQSLPEALAAVAHWRSHSYLSGCSHGR